MREDMLEKKVKALKEREKKLIECVKYYADEEHHRRARDNGCYVTGKHARQCLVELNKPEEKIIPAIPVCTDCGA